MVDTSIQEDVNLLNELKKRKMLDRETYADVIRDLIEDSKELSEQTRKEIEKSRAEIRAGRYYTLGEVKKQLEAR